MAITAEHAGRRYPPTGPYEITAAKIVEFAQALGDRSPGYAGGAPVAPPTFVATVIAGAWEQLFSDPDLELDLARVMHADQRLSWTRPLRAGDRVTTTMVIDQVRVRAGTEIIASTADLEVDGTVVCVAQATFWHSRGES